MTAALDVQQLAERAGADLLRSLQIATQAEMAAELSASFPTMPKQLIGDVEPFLASESGIVVIAASSTAMPDGLPILWPSACINDASYDGRVHGGFVRWLEVRGWECRHIDATNSLKLTPDLWAAAGNRRHWRWTHCTFRRDYSELRLKRRQKDYGPRPFRQLQLMQMLFDIQHQFDPLQTPLQVRLASFKHGELPF